MRLCRNSRMKVYIRRVRTSGGTVYARGCWPWVHCFVCPCTCAKAATHSDRHRRQLRARDARVGIEVRRADLRASHRHLRRRYPINRSSCLLRRVRSHSFSSPRRTSAKQKRLNERPPSKPSLTTAPGTLQERALLAAVGCGNARTRRSAHGNDQRETCSVQMADCARLGKAQ